MRMSQLLPALSILAALGFLAGAAASPPNPEKVNVVATLTTYKAIAREVGGDRVEVQAIAKGNQDAHFVNPKPSFALMLKDADLFLTTGLDLELWVPALQDKARNSKIREGQVGYVSLATGIPMLQVPQNPSRAGGDIHIYGNPHIHTDPLRAKIIAGNIAIGLKKADRANADYYDRQLAAFKRRIDEALFGPELVELVGGDQLSRLAMEHRLAGFLEQTSLGGAPLTTRLGGWLKEAECLRGKKIIAYHLNWIYFTDRFGIQILDYVEDKPGIPPSAQHVVNLITLIRDQEVKALLVVNFFDEKVPRLIEQRTGAKALIVPLEVEGTPGVQDYFQLVDTWIRALKSAFPDCQEEA